MKFKHIFTLSISTFLTPFALASCGVQNLSVLNIVEDEKTLKVGQTYNIKISQENLNDVIIFSSSNSDVASVDSHGVVTALKKGSSIIEAKCGLLKDTIRIIVNDDISISELTLTIKDEEVKVGESTILEVFVEPKEYFNDVSFETISGADNILIDGTEVKALKAGDALIRAKLESRTSNEVSLHIYDFIGNVMDREIFEGDLFPVTVSLTKELTDTDITVEFDNPTIAEFSHIDNGTLFFRALKHGNTSFFIRTNDGSVSNYIDLTVLKDNNYENIDKEEFYANYTKAIDASDAKARSDNYLMSGDISKQDQEPTISSYQPTSGNKLVKNSTYTFSSDNLSYDIYDENGDFANRIFKNGAYITLEEVAAYVFAFGDVPVNYYEDRNDYPKPYESPWREYLRLNNSKFSGDTSKYKYEPELPRISGCGGDLIYYEIDIGTTGTDCDPSYDIADYNDGRKITRGAARIVYSAKYTNGQLIKNLEDRYVFYTYNHYNDFQEYLNYENGRGKIFGNVTGGSKLNKYDRNNPPTEYPEVVYRSL